MMGRTCPPCSTLSVCLYRVTLSVDNSHIVFCHTYNNSLLYTRALLSNQMYSSRHNVALFHNFLLILYIILLNRDNTKNSFNYGYSTNNVKANSTNADKVTATKSSPYSKTVSSTNSKNENDSKATSDNIDIKNDENDINYGNQPV